jgi:hypothetical protein
VTWPAPDPDTWVARCYSEFPLFSVADKRRDGGWVKGRHDLYPVGPANMSYARRLPVGTPLLYGDVVAQGEDVYLDKSGHVFIDIHAELTS